MTTKATEMLKQAKEFLSKREHWCPCGSGDGINQACAYTAVGIKNKDYADSFYKAISYLPQACSKLVGHGFVAALNDGTEEHVGIDAPVRSEDERFKLVHEIYDLAIKLSEEES